MGGRPLPLMTLPRLPHLSGLRPVVPKLLKELQKVNPQTCTYLLIARLYEPRRPGVCVCVSLLVMSDSW